MSKYVIEQPPATSGNATRDIMAMRSYLYRMNENLQLALSSLTAENFSSTGLSQVRGDAAAKEKAQAQEQEYLALRSLIIKTADTVQAEIEELEAELHGEYVALSDFGAYQESVSNEISATATGIVQSYGYDAQLHALELAQASFETYQVTTEQYIKSGLLYYDGAVPRYGVAVGENLTTVTVDGQEVLSRQGLCATFTSDRLSFWMGGTEVAYVSNEQLHITAAEIDQIDMGNWRISHSGGFSITWIG